MAGSHSVSGGSGLAVTCKKGKKNCRGVNLNPILYFQININHFGLNRSIFFFQKLAMIKFKIIEKAE